MLNPVELIGQSRRRLARIAALKAAARLIPPIVVTFVIAAAFTWIGGMTWEKAGYVLGSAHAAAIRDALFALGVAEVALMCAWAIRAYRENDFAGAAARIDELVGAHQEVITLALLADPAVAERRGERTPLFPMLWRRVISYLDVFEPRRAFRPRLGRALAESSLLSLAIVVALGLATLALMRPPTPEQALARNLHQIARQLAASSNPADHALANMALNTAKALENPHLPPREKNAALQKLERQLQQQAHTEEVARNGSGQANSGGSGRGNGKGSGSGNGAGNGNGTGPGSGAGQSSGSSQNGKNKNTQLAELHNDIAKAQAQIQVESGPRDQSKGDQSGNQKGTSLTPKAGSNPNQPGPRNNPNGHGIAIPQPGNLAQNKANGNHSSGNKNDKGLTGDTHLGEFPKAENFQRYIKPGDKGPPIAIHDARYVLFRLPPAIATEAGTGGLVPDTTRPTVTTPYTNAPLKQRRLTVTPEERQLVPPRYRNLIR
ncbi:MAG: hypothetical protein ACREQ4_09180 [Candidatus Binataceae bacterium]